MEISARLRWTLASLMILAPFGIAYGLASSPPWSFDQLGSLGDFMAGWASCWTVAGLIAIGPETLRSLRRRRVHERAHELGIEVSESIDRCRDQALALSAKMDVVAAIYGQTKIVAELHRFASETRTQLESFRSRTRAIGDDKVPSAISLLLSNFHFIEVFSAVFEMSFDEASSHHETATLHQARDAAARKLKILFREMEPDMVSVIRECASLAERVAGRTR